MQENILKNISENKTEKFIEGVNITNNLKKYTHEEDIQWGIEKTLNVLIPQGDIFEIRILEKSQFKNVYSGYFEDVNTAIKQIEFFKRVHKNETFNYYLTLNKINSACFSRLQRNNLIKTTVTTKDDDIIGYRLILIDLDPERLSEISSTDDELGKAEEKAKEIKTFLQSKGFKEPVLAQSGNGYHLLYKVDFNATNENREIVKSFLEALSFIFSKKSVNVDVKNYNPARITKLYGTLACKGANTKERPHRMSKLIEVPQNFEVNDIALLKEIAEQKTIKEAIKPTYSNKSIMQSNPNFLEDFIEKHNIQIKETKEDGAYTKYILRECPFNSEHKAPDAMLTKNNNGAVGFFCFHKHCANNHWEQFRQLYEPDYKSNHIPSTVKHSFYSNSAQNNNNNETVQSNTEKKKEHDLVKLADFLENDTAIKGKIFEDTCAHEIYCEGVLPWDNNAERRPFDNEQESKLKIYIAKKYAVNDLHTNWRDAFNCFLFNNKRNLLQERLKLCYKNWDNNTGHIKKLLPYFLGAEDTAFTYEALKVFMLGGIYRTFKPGTKFDYTLILSGEQGIGKSTFFERLAFQKKNTKEMKKGEEWCADLHTLEGKAAQELLQGKLIVVFDELVALKKARDYCVVKNFLTKTTDRFRVPYSVRPKDFDRACIFCGTTNKQTFFKEFEGNRRFLTIYCYRNPKDKKFLAREVEWEHEAEQAWGEAMNLYYCNEKDGSKLDLLFLPDSAQEEQEAINEQATEIDEREGEIEFYLNKEPKKDETTILDIWVNCLNRELKDRKINDSRAIGKILTHLGWKQGGRKRSEDNNWGLQRIWKRCN